MKYFWAAVILLIGCSPARQITKEITNTENVLQEHLGFYLVDLSSNRTVIDFNGAKYFTPASNTKIFTLYTSLKLLGDSIASLKCFQSGDSLIFQGMGDPSFLYKNVFDNGRTYRFLKDHPSKLFYSSKNFQTESFGPGWAWDDYNDDYSAERSSFPIYGNLISVEHPTSELFVFEPFRFSSDFHISNEIHKNEEIIRGVDSNQLVYFNGKKKSKSFTIPFRTSNDLLVDLLSDTLHRSVEEINRPFPQNSFVLKSTPLDSLYKVMIQDSDNFIAEQLLLQCAALVSDTLKPEIAIRYAKKNFFSHFPDSIQWVDGSGLSRYNLFTPRSIVEVWKKIYQVVPQERLFNLLTVNGKSGTLKYWFKADDPFIWGKSGSLSNVRSLSGFLITKKNKILIFCLMNNNFTNSGTDVRKRIEKILKQIHDKF